jgi:hypothetical protein
VRGVASRASYPTSTPRRQLAAVLIVGYGEKLIEAFAGNYFDDRIEICPDMEFPMGRRW